MCHQSVGLIQDAIERAGIPTVSLTVVPFVTQHMNVSRSAYVRFPIGNPCGEADNASQQSAVVSAALDLFEIVTEPGSVVELPFRWKRHEAHVPPSDENLSIAYLTAREFATELFESHAKMVELCEIYAARMAELSEELADDSDYSAQEIHGIEQFISWLNPLIELLNKPVQEQVIWNSSRYFLLQTMHAGRFR